MTKVDKPKGRITFSLKNDDKFELFYDDAPCQFELFEYTFTFESIQYRLYLFSKALFKLPQKLGRWLFENTNYAVQEYEGCRTVKDES